jgi:hypothetical protein
MVRVSVRHIIPGTPVDAQVARKKDSFSREIRHAITNCVCRAHPSQFEPTLTIINRKEIAECDAWLFHPVRRQAVLAAGWVSLPFALALR